MLDIGVNWLKDLQTFLQVASIFIIYTKFEPHTRYTSSLFHYLFTNDFNPKDYVIIYTCICCCNCGSQYVAICGGDSLKL